MTNPGLRASDDDRRVVLAALERHTAAGRLTLDEFGERVTRVLAAATHGDLSTITSDLPAEAATTPQPAAESANDVNARQLAIAFVLAVLTLIVIGVVLAIAR